MRSFGLVLVIGSVILLAACGGNGGGSGGGSGSSTITAVNVACTPNPVGSGGSSQCSATVSGTGNFSSAVSWSASAGSISSSGVLTAPVVSGTTTPGGGGNSNVQPIVVDAGPQPQSFVSANVPYTTVTVCAPGTTNCQTIDHISVDTGSEGLRLLSGVLNSAPITVTATSTQDTTKSGSVALTATLLPLAANNLNECLVFADGFVWGPVAAADISFPGATAETAASTPVHILIPATSTPAVPSTCMSQNPAGGAGNEGGSVMTFGSNGILGVGPFQNDCGAYCTSMDVGCGSSGQPCVYYTCSGSSCSGVNLPVAQQVPNPVIFFAADNNGVLLQLPNVPAGGSQNPAGSMIFGINTEPNNNLSQANNVYQIPDTGGLAGTLITTYQGQAYNISFLDSGSNGLYFLDSNHTGIPTCSGNSSGFYCPNNPAMVMATNQGQDANGNPLGSSGPANFTIDNALNLFNSSNTAFSTLGGPYFMSCGTGNNPACAFDFGLPFFFGKNVFTAIDGAPVSGAPTGPFFAY
jgi:Protein of unknown function (DUF3443)